MCQNQLVLWFHLNRKKVYNNGTFEGDYDQIHSDIKDAMALAMNLQTPDQMIVGVANTEFESEIPFKI